MRESHPIEQSMGMQYYSTDILGIGGRVKAAWEDFLVQEITPDGTLLPIRPQDEFHSLTISGEPDRFITMTVQKAGLTTMDVAQILASSLKIPWQHVGYAGLKDKRALTVQSMSIPRRTEESLHDLELHRILLSNLHYTRNPVQIGELWGNHFSIRITELDVDISEAIRSAEFLRGTPILNYFGVQRFGVIRPATHLTGRALVRKDYKDAVMRILTTTSEFEDDDLREARLELQDDLVISESILGAFPKDLSTERNIIKHLMKHPDDFERAIVRIPPRIKTLMVHSYQSYLFNCLISERVKRGFPLDVPEVGDFIMKLDTTHSGRDSWRFVTERNLDESLNLVSSGEYGLVCPLPGYATKTPPSTQSDILREVLKNESISLYDFRNKKHRDLDSYGGFHLASITVDPLSITGDEGSLELGFSLRKGSYATVVLRELMRNHPINRI